MVATENGWPAIGQVTDPLLYTWTLNTHDGHTVRLTLRHGSVGFVLVYAASLWDRWIEPLYGGLADDGGYSYREVRGRQVLSNHASGTAEDLNWRKHPLGAVGTVAKAGLWRTLLLRFRTGSVGSILRWGGDYHNRKDEMHTEIAPGVTMTMVENVAKRLMTTKRGRQILHANPGQHRVILS